MRKIILILMGISFFSITLFSSENKRSNFGYKEFIIGDSKEKVLGEIKKNYSKFENRVYVDNKFISIQIEINDKKVNEIRLYFYENELYSIRVEMIQMSSSEWDQFLSYLKEKYGNPFKCEFDNLGNVEWCGWDTIKYRLEASQCLLGIGNVYQKNCIMYEDREIAKRREADQNKDKRKEFRGF